MIADPIVAILETRMKAETVALFARAGLRTFSAPALHEAPVDAGAAVADFISELAAQRLPIVVLLTGAGVRALVREAERASRLAELLDGLRGTTLVCRGPKPVAALRTHKIVPQIVAAEPHTTRELLEAMAPLALAGARIGVVHFGERNAVLVAELIGRGATVSELSLYEWRLPADTTPLRQLVTHLIAGTMDAIAFTSQVQVRHLFQIAEAEGCVASLVDALRSGPVVASIGPTCTAVLESYGLHPDVEPVHPKLGHLVRALAARLEAAVPRHAGSAR